MYIHEALYRDGCARTSVGGLGRGRSGSTSVYRAQGHSISDFTRHAEIADGRQLAKADHPDPRPGGRRRTMDVGLAARRPPVSVQTPPGMILLDTNAVLWIDRGHPRANVMRRSGALYVSPA